MKKQLKKLTFVKERISMLDSKAVLGGAAPNDGGDTPDEPIKNVTFLHEGCGLSVHRPACGEPDSIYYCDI
ncbi:hypothetical protein C8N46_101382 [Kordia periserrulae]|uniref:Uncharacterized protein n=1 Tax=Kordia periserrulae TaxID=701523 RepID=A0A2T6C670_9FLAO|nr:hypothetical protein [Kordia periserrulae]PTX63776.1 hypothetical protein C8N46_101382 [Kordia periserrulae]